MSQLKRDKAGKPFGSKPGGSKEGYEHQGNELSGHSLFQTTRRRRTESAKALLEQIYAGMTEHEAVAKENGSMRDGIREAKDELRILRRKDVKTTKQTESLKKEIAELRASMSQAGAAVGPQRKSYQRLLWDFTAEQKKSMQLKQKVADTEESELYKKWQTGKSNYVKLRRLCSMLPNCCALLLHGVSGLVEKPYAARSYPG